MIPSLKVLIYSWFIFNKNTTMGYYESSSYYIKSVFRSGSILCVHISYNWNQYTPVDSINTICPSLIFKQIHEYG